MPFGRFLPSLFFFCASCASLSPRFTPAVANNFATSEMRKLTTESAEIYYPAEAEAAAQKVAARMGHCLTALREHPMSDAPPGKALIYLTSANFNNAYVTGQAGGEPLHTVDPLFTTTELLNWYGLTSTETGDIGCHELLHFVHFEQVGGLWWLVNLVFGPALPPQTSLERWFTEGLAQYYEGRLGRAVGRPHSPFYRAMFESGIASRNGDSVRAGDLSPSQRELLPASGAYLASLPFIEWLAQKYGEQKLWRVIDAQSTALIPPLAVTLRFKNVYGLSLGALVDTWSDELRHTIVPRPRPTAQSVLRGDAGYFARLASAPDGSLALISEGLDEMATLHLFGPDGTERASVWLTQLLPGRDWASAGPLQMSGLSFTADSRFLYLVNDDLSLVGDDLAQIWQVDAVTGRTLNVWKGFRGGQGGSIHPSGSRYLLVQNSPGNSELVDVDLQTDQRRVLESSSRAFAAPSWSPDGSRLIYSQWSGENFDLVLREPSGETRQLTHDASFNYGARFIDQDHVLFARAYEGRLQAHVMSLSDGTVEVVSAAPWALIDPVPLGADRVAFLNRDGWGWSLDTAPRTALASVALTAPANEPIAAPADPEPLPSIHASPIEGLFVPQLRAPTVAFSPFVGADETLGVLQAYTATLLGRDRLGYHSWQLDLSLTLPTLQNSQSFIYATQLLAPWSLSAGVARDQDRPVSQYTGGVSLSRSIYAARVGASFAAIDRLLESGGQTRYIGPTVSLSYGAGDGTSYAGTQRSFSIGASVSMWPRAFGSSIDVADFAGSLSLSIPLPFLKRHSFAVGIGARVLAGAPPGSLRVGGVGRGTTLLQGNQSDGGGPSNGAFLPASFVVGVRGFEDYWVFGNKTAQAEARYRYPFIVDRGTASTLYLLPSFFFRQIDLELFGAAAATDNPITPWLRSAGAMIALRTIFGQQLPVSLSYQFSVRFDAGLKPLHTLFLSFE